MRGRWKSFCAVLAVTVLVSGCAQTAAKKPAVFTSGYVNEKEVVVYSGVLGTITKINCDLGDKVTKDQIILEIDDSEIKAAIAQADSTRASTLSRLNQARQTENQMIASYENIVKQRQAELKKGQDNLAKAKAALDQQEQLLKAGKITQQDYDNAKLAYQNAQSQLNAAALDVQSTEQTLSFLRGLAANGFVSTIQGQVKDTTLQEQVAKSLLAKCKIKAPITGDVIARNVESGEVIFPERALFTIADPQQKWVDTYIPQSNLDKIHIGSKVKITAAEAFTGRTFEGTVTWISPRSEFTPKVVQSKDQRSKSVFAVKIALPPDTELKAGMAVDIDVAGD
ncbi:MAG: HlyD family secretion protein [Candidatus Saccharibacteria bacterium]